MNRPQLVGVLSTVLGSTAGFLVLTRWSLAGTVTGAILMPVIFTSVSFCSHEIMKHVGRWFNHRMKGESFCCPADESVNDEPPATVGTKPLRRSLQWSVVALAFLAFAFSLYSVTQDRAEGVTIFRDRVVEMVTVTTEKPTYSMVRTVPAESTTVTTAPQPESQDQTTTTATVPAEDSEPTTDTTDTTVHSEGTTTTTIP